MDFKNKLFSFNLEEDIARAKQLQRDEHLWQHGRGTASDGQDTNAHCQPTCHLTTAADSIVIYYSRSGSTELLAHSIASIIKGDILEIVIQNPYDTNYQKTLERANYERVNQNYPLLKMKMPNLDQYQTIYLGYPVWAMTLSHPMTAFLNTYGSKLHQKTIAPFMTQGGYGAGDSIDKIKEILYQKHSNNNFVNPLVIDGNKVNQAHNQIERWLSSIRK
ncbi:flavodoxin family protein [Bombilactobacillus bombi]|uniref:flavodoxin family protein n=1 Tax=Bombilactobacillus bombi TaxID=1303590 RepID=UPI0015E5CC1F|nr:flavodoxin [Bombilactobacillus bombi]MBA1433940.1 flavodoxin [Bombilactobacillus bombi]